MEKTVYHGIVRGKNIELEEAPPFPVGESVTVEIHPHQRYVNGDGVRASAGAWADAGEKLDRWLEDVYHARRSGRSAKPS